MSILYMADTVSTRVRDIGMLDTHMRSAIMILMASQKKAASVVTTAFYKASFTIIALLCLNYVLLFMVFMSGFRYISGGEPEWHDAVQKASLIFLMYIAPFLYFLGAGAFIGFRVRSDVLKHGARFGLMWTIILFFAVQIMYATMLVNKVYTINQKFINMWQHMSLAIAGAGVAIIFISALGGLLGELAAKKRL